MEKETKVIVREKNKSFFKNGLIITLWEIISGQLKVLGAIGVVALAAYAILQGESFKKDQTNKQWKRHQAQLSSPQINQERPEGRLTPICINNYKYTILHASKRHGYKKQLFPHNEPCKMTNKDFKEMKKIKILRVFNQCINQNLYITMRIFEGPNSHYYSHHKIKNTCD